jgi:maltose O-acetyltransferase
MTEKEKMLRGELYDAKDVELTGERLRAEELLARYNAGRDVEVLRSLLGAMGEGSEVRAPFYCDYGSNIVMGSGVFLNFGCVLLDVCEISIGDGTQIGPGVQIYAADHPRDAAVRLRGLENGRPVRVGKNVWIGGGAILLPGITVGDDAVIGAGSVVTKDVAAGSTVMGNPARVKGTR